MSYVTAEAMINKFGETEIIELTSSNGFSLEINYDKLQLAIDAANSEIDGYLASRYQLPLSQVPPFLVSIGCDMAHFHASVGDTQETSRTRTRYEIAIKNLINISKGLVALGGKPAGESAPAPTSQNNVMWVVGRNDFKNGY
ncbi:MULTISPECIES: gp436 family protein [unclassified Acinetobacter]|uniref:gp436 family protein n=1 Tax=unclassified Acinetobacter TaxID=196816 RepID=UPI00190BD6A3|nr:MULTISPECIES: DUF1320 domain-containing protein [unclassified Acinetobacter]MBK0062388.1 DUF1320 domain-containing protein [Acinetobacter sp. S55]MBK0066192.1 DUF1320 domain-containing protein [Acinetobacter sp. S54]